VDPIDRFLNQEQDRIEKLFVSGEQTPLSPDVQLFRISHWGHDDDYGGGDGGGSNYTTSTAHSDTTSSGSTARQSSKPSIVFSRRTGQSSSSEISSIPPRHPLQLSFVQTLNQTNPTLAPPAALAEAPPPLDYSRSDILWCEFCVFMKCDRVYDFNEMTEWIEHHCRHMEDTFPAKLKCWFCDHVPFEAAHERDRLANFHKRMEHVCTHIFDDPHPLTAYDMRPDYYLIQHMRRKGLISGKLYNDAMQYTELPPALRIPGGYGGSPSETPRTMPSIQEGRLPPLRHDLRRETRPRRPRASHRS